MRESDQFNSPPEFQEQRLLFYQMSFDDEASDQQVESDEFQSPIYTELKSIGHHFTDKTLHSIGGMKVISKIKDLRTGRQIAMAEMKKKSKISQEDIEQFLREARITAALEHPGIVPIYDIGLSKNKLPFFTMKFMQDESLKKVLRELVKANPAYTKKYTLGVLLDILLKICDTIAYTHSHNVVHLDLKPSNVMIGQYGEVYICDWGLAKQLNSSEKLETSSVDLIYDSILDDTTLTGVVKGTPGFMAPEQIDEKFGKKNKQTDIYALGALLYSILVLRRPYFEYDIEQTLSATLEKRLVEPKEASLLDVPESLNAICMKAMEKDKKLRYKTVDDLATDIRSFQGGFTTEAEDVSLTKALLFFIKRNRTFSVMLFIFFFTMLALSGFFVHQLRKEQKIAQVQSQHDQEKVAKKFTQLREDSDRKIKNFDQHTKFLKTKLLHKQRLLKKLFTTAPSIRGQAISLNGNQQGIENQEFQFESGTLSFWFYPERSSYQYPNFFQLGNSKWHLDDKDHSGGIVLNMAGEYVKPENIGGPLWDKWHHFAVTVSPNDDMIFYIDGIKIDILTNYEGGEGFAIGSWLGDDGEKSMKARIDEVSIWSAPLKHDAVKELANKVLVGNEQGLRVYYKLDGNGNNSLDDKHHLVIEGTPVFVP